MTAAWYFCSWQKATEDKEWLCLLSKRLASFFIPYWNRNRKSLRIENEKHNWNWKQHTSVSQMRYHLHWILNALILLSWNQRTNWCDVFLNKIRPKNGVCFTSSSLPRENFWKSLLRLVNTFELALVCGDYIILLSPSRSDVSKNINTLESCFIVETEVVILNETKIDTVFHI